MNKSLTRRIGVLAILPLLILPLFASAGTVPNWSRSLSFGLRGQDVLELQNFLIAQGDLAAENNTGYFGRLTEAAVKKFQCRTNIVCSGSPSSTGYGAVGPRTRAKILEGFGSGGTASANFSAYPTSGSAPLSVQFINTYPNGVGQIDFGDGQWRSAPATHTYATAGTYTAKLCILPFSLPAGSAPPPPGCASTDAIGTVTITVTGTSVIPNDKQSCENIGGKWGSVGDAPNAALYCNMPTGDAGKVCTDSSQCQSFCKATTYAEPGTPVGGVCYGWKEASCTGGIANGKATPIACY